MHLKMVAASEHQDDAEARLEVKAMELRPGPAADVASSRLLRTLGFGAIEDEVRRLLRTEAVDRFVGAPWAGGSRRRPGRRGADPRGYALLAARYVRALRSEPRAPYRRMVEELAAEGWHETEQGLRQKIRRARQLDPPVLTEASKGKAGGELTEHGRDLAREWGEEV